MIDLSCSIVLYHNSIKDIDRAVNSIINSSENVKLFLVDNSTNDALRYVLNYPGVEYIYNGRNLGYGAGHNVAIQKNIGKSKFHLILNPDVEFDPSILRLLIRFMTIHKNAGLVMPKVLYPDGSLQYLCKKLPNPAHLFLRRFLPERLKKIFKKSLDMYELRDKDYNSIMLTPNLSGCFMFIRTEAFTKVGLFDERYFMYLEDTDLCRRIGEKYQTVYYPEVSIIHDYSKGSYKSFKLMKQHLKSSIKYFNKWGWFNDKKRKLLNAVIDAGVILNSSVTQNVKLHSVWDDLHPGNTASPSDKQSWSEPVVNFN